MPRTVPNAFWQQVTARTNDDPFIWAVEITHSSISDALRLACSPVDVVSNGKTYLASFFQFSAPTETDETARGSIVIQNVNQYISQAVRRVKGDVGCRALSWLESDPDTIIHDYPLLTLNRFEVNALTVSAELWAHDVAGEPCPARRATPEATPGLWVA
jgi:hypothetical protein